jgi:hypothetical protein
MWPEGKVPGSPDGEKKEGTMGGNDATEASLEEKIEQIKARLLEFGKDEL